MSEIRFIMKTVWKFFVDNLDTLLAVALSIVAAVLGVFGGIQFQNQLLSAIAATLGLLAYALIRERNSRANLLKMIEGLRPDYGAGAFLKDRSSYVPFDRLIESAQYVGLVGPSLVNLFLPWKDYFQTTKLEAHGAEIQAAIIDPDSPIVESAAACINISPEGLRQEIQNTLIQANSILEKQRTTQRGTFELRLLKANPNYSMILIDPDKPHGTILVEFIGYHAGLHKRPHIELHKERDGAWYEHFLEQYRELLENGNTYLSKK